MVHGPHVPLALGLHFAVVVAVRGHACSVTVADLSGLLSRRCRVGGATVCFVTLASLLAKNLLRVAAVFQDQADFVTLAGLLGQALLRDVGRPIGSELVS